MSITWNAATRTLSTPIYASDLPYWPGVAQGTILFAMYARFSPATSLFRPFFSFATGSGGGFGGLASNTYQAYNRVAATPEKQEANFGGGGQVYDAFATTDWENSWVYFGITWTRTGPNVADREMSLIVASTGNAQLISAASESGAWSITTKPRAAIFGGDASLSPTFNGFGNSSNTFLGSIANITIANRALTLADVQNLLTMPAPNAIGIGNVLAYWPLQRDYRSVIGTTDELVWNGTTSPDPNFRPTFPEYTAGTPRNRDRGRRIP